MTLEYQLTFAGVPFFADDARKDGCVTGTPYPLFGRIEELIPSRWLQDFAPAAAYPGRKLGSLARMSPGAFEPNPREVQVGEWFYPSGACRWSVFRGLATSTQVRHMLAAVRDTSVGNPITTKWIPATFVMAANPAGPTTEYLANPNAVLNHVVSTSLYMLPPRPLAETAGTLDGLYLVTLVDERYYWQFTSSATLHPQAFDTWDDLLQILAGVLGVSLLHDGTPAYWGRPEPDSQLWTASENAAVLLDAVALNVGCAVVRNLDGTYELQTTAKARDIALSNRNHVGPIAFVDSIGPLSPTSEKPVARRAGGDMYQSGGLLPVGDLNPSRNHVPAAVRVVYPIYIYGQDPVPHFLNGRYAGARPSAWNEDSYGHRYSVVVPITSGGLTVSGYAGVYIQGFQGAFGISGAAQSGMVIDLLGSSPEQMSVTLHDTAKAFISGESQLANLSVFPPLNGSGLTALAMELARDYYDRQGMVALDEVYPGIFAWRPEAIHDIVWTYSPRLGVASTRVLRGEWNQVCSEFQHSVTMESGYAAKPILDGPMSGWKISRPGNVSVGGRSVALTVTDSYSGSVQQSQPSEGGPPQARLTATLNSGALTANLAPWRHLPTDNRWRGMVNGEVILFEGTSGGDLGHVDIVCRGDLGTVTDTQANDSVVKQVVPNASYGTNLLRFGRGQFTYPGELTSGGIQGVHVVPQLQNVFCLDGTGRLINDVLHHSGAVSFYDYATRITEEEESRFKGDELCWIIERNWGTLSSGLNYAGQFAGYAGSSDSTPDAAPVYLTAEGGGSEGPPGEDGEFAPDVNYYRNCKASTSPLFDRWYTADVGRGDEFANASIAPNFVYLLPFVAPAGGRIKRIAVFNANNNQPPVSVCLGIYGRVDTAQGGIADNRPGLLLYAPQQAAGLQAAGAGLVTGTGDLEFEAGELYWLAFACKTAVTLRALPANKLFPILGFRGSTTTPLTDIFRYSCGAMRSPLPSSFTQLPVNLSQALDDDDVVCEGNLPLIAVQYDECVVPDPLPPCGGHETLPVQWQLVVAGIGQPPNYTACPNTGADFTGCTRYNGTHVLTTAVQGNCNWDTKPDTCQCNGTPLWSMFYINSLQYPDTWVLKGCGGYGGPNGPQYVLPNADFNPNGPNTFTKDPQVPANFDNDATFCTGFPAQLTLTPA
jgi:hypothetical protein